MSDTSGAQNSADAALGTELLTPERLHARYATRIDRHVRAVLGHDHEREDLVQDVLITVFRKVGALRDPACLDRWVNQVTFNTLRYVMRQRRLRRHASWDGLTEQQVPSFQIDVDGRDLAGRVIEVMGRLPPSDRRLLTTYWFSPATAASIASETGCSIVTVRRRLLKARTRFERLARRDPALSRCLDDARVWSRRFRHSALEVEEGAPASRDSFEDQQTASAA